MINYKPKITIRIHARHNLDSVNPLRTLIYSHIPECKGIAAKEASDDSQISAEPIVMMSPLSHICKIQQKSLFYISPIRGDNIADKHFYYFSFVRC